jgi:phage terminase large subunit-like protein
VKAGPKGSVLVDRPLHMADLPKAGGDRVAAWIEKYLAVPRGTGALQPFRLRSWQVDIVRGLYDSPRPRQALLSMPRANGKSSLAAALALYSLFGDREQGAQVLVVASDQRQAGIVYGLAARMLELSPPLADRALVYADKLVVPSTDSTMTALPSEPGALQGWDPSLMVVDELAYVTDDVWEAVTGAAGKRATSLTLAISTPAGDRDGVMHRLVQYGREGGDPAFYFKEFSAPNDCAVDDEDAWKVSNPALGDFLHRDAMRAVSKTMRESQFRRYRLGTWVDGESSWIGWDDWQACANKIRTVNRRDEVVLAFDGSWSGDSTALVGCTLDGHLFLLGLWENPGDDRWRVPRELVDAAVNSAFQKFRVLELACDPWGWRSEIDGWAKAHGPSKVIEYPTNNVRRMAPATDRLYAAVQQQQVTHSGDERLAAHVAHCVAKSTPLGDLVIKSDQKSPKKIDAAVCAIVAFDRAAWHRNNRKTGSRWAVSR